MKERYENNDDSFTKTHMGEFGYQPSFLERQNDEFISPFIPDKREIPNIYNNSPTYLNSFNRNITNENNTIPFNNFNYLYDNFQFTRVNLLDEEKKVLQPRDSSFIDKLLDILLNW